MAAGAAGTSGGGCVRELLLLHLQPLFQLGVCCSMATCCLGNAIFCSSVSICAAYSAASGSCMTTFGRAARRCAEAGGRMKRRRHGSEMSSAANSMVAELRTERGREVRAEKNLDKGSFSEEATPKLLYS